MDSIPKVALHARLPTVIYMAPGGLTVVKQPRFEPELTPIGVSEDVPDVKLILKKLAISKTQDITCMMGPSMLEIFIALIRKVRRSDIYVLT